MSASTLQQQQQYKWKCYGHRGVPSKYPENTLQSFRAAYDANADGIELDVRLTRDEEVIVLHDFALNRTTDGEGPVHTVDYWGYVEKLRTRNTRLGAADCVEQPPQPAAAATDTGERRTSSVKTTMEIDAKQQPGSSHQEPTVAEVTLTRTDAGAPTGELTDQPVPRLVEVLDWLLTLERPLGLVIDVKVLSLDLLPHTHHSQVAGQFDNPLAIMHHLKLILARDEYASLLPRTTIGIWSPHFLPSLIALRRYNNAQLAPIRRSLITRNIGLAKTFVSMSAVDHVSVFKQVAIDNQDWIRNVTGQNQKGAIAEDQQQPSIFSWRYWFSGNQHQENGCGNITVSVWTVDRDAEFQAVTDVGVNEILTNCPVKCLRFRDEPHGRLTPVNMAAADFASQQTDGASSVQPVKVLGDQEDQVVMDSKDVVKLGSTKLSTNLPNHSEY
ncbi:hypothetical protein RI367_001492 [Sorochytrium milnesiophthora]